VLDENYGAAALYAPPDGDSPNDGILSIGELGASQWVYGEVDPDRVARWRTEGTVRPHEHWPEQLPGGPAPALSCEIVSLI
ncbi:MAG: amidohydrolase, partial [Sphingobium sp.]|nr:amidohydrolase [Sphingobium sp.]